MAFATELTIGTANKVSLNYQSHEVNVSVTYQLEREDTDVVAVVREKTAELAQAHRAAWQTLRDSKVAAAKARQGVIETNPQEATPQQEATPAPEPPPESPPVAVAPEPTPVEPPITPGQVAALSLLLRQGGWDEGRRTDYLRERFSREDVDDLSAEQARQWLLELQRAERDAIQQRRLENTHRNGTP